MRKIFCTIAALASLATLSARELSPEEALSRLSNDAHKVRGINSSSSRLIYTQADTLGEAAAYVFASPEGLLVVGADDVAAPLLGYTDAPATAESLPPNMLAWLRDYARQIASARSAAPYKASAADSKAAISPLLSSKWNQSSPYNMYCPTISGTQCPTGCLATAMAQIMNYHQWPEKGTGNIDYYTRTRNVRVQCNIGDYTLDWANMLNGYTSSASTKQKQAVGRLMQVVGASLEMDYNTDASGAYGVDATTALIDNFYYDPAGAYYMREWFSLTDWQNIVYNELASNRPVLYCGSGSAGGHAFVCDGYSSNGYFHINWGWGGTSDGYFLLDALAPEVQGIGGNGMHFNDSQSINLGICKKNANPIYRLYNTHLDPNKSTAKAGNAITIQSEYYAVQDIPSGVSLSVRFVIENMATGAQTPVSSNLNNYVNGLPIWNGFGSLSISWPSGLADGSYRIKAQHKIGSNDWTDIAFPQQEATCWLYAEVKSGTATFTHTRPEVQEPDPESPFEITAAKPSTSIYVGAPYKADIVCTNPSNSDFNGTVCAAFYTISGQLASVGAPLQLNISAGSDATVEYESTFEWQTGATYSPGVYVFKIIDYQAYTAGDIQTLSADVNVKVKSGAPQLTVTTWNIPSADNVDPANLQINIWLSCEDGIYENPLLFAVGNETLQTETFRLGKDDTKVLNLTYTLPYSERNLALSVTPLNGYTKEPIADPIDIVVNKFVEPVIELKAWSIPSADDVDPANLQANFTLTCTAGTYEQPLALAVYDADGDYLTDLMTPTITLAEGKTQTFRLKLEFPYTDTNGEFDLYPCSIDSEGNTHALTDQPTHITVNKFVEPVLELRAWNIPSVDNVNPEHLQVNMTLTCTAGKYENYIYFQADKIGSDDTTSFVSPDIALGEGETKTFRWSLVFPIDEPNAEFDILPCFFSEGYAHYLTEEPIRIVVNRSDSINEITANQSEAKIYTPNGTEASSLRKGVYIIVDGKSARKILK